MPQFVFTERLYYVCGCFLHASGGSLSDSPERDERATKGERGFDSPLPFGILSP